MSKNKLIDILLKIVLPWIIVFGAIQGFFVEVITVNNPLLASLYFAGISLGIIVVFRRLFKSLLSETSNKSFHLVTLSLAVHFLVYLLCNNYVNPPVRLIEQNPISFLLVNSFFLWSIPLNILNQQLLLIVLMHKLKSAHVSMKSTICIAIVLFGVPHLYQIFRLTLPFALYFVGFALAGGIIMPYQFYKSKNGYLHNFIVHLAFYDLSALFFWLLFA